jgi:hypothetical protein
LQYLLNQHGMACQSNARWGCCGNFYYDFCFVFGSCRNFFSETCFPTAHGFVGPYGGTGYGGAGCGAGGCAR